MVRISRADYAAIYGPTAGDQIRLGDTDLWIEIEQDLTFGGEESVFGGGKSIRESMNQSEVTRAEGALDTVITNADRARPLGDRPRRRRHSRRADRRDRPQRQSRDRRRRRPGPGHRRQHRRHLRRGQDPHRRWLRQPRALPVPVPDHRGARGGPDHPRRRRHGAVGGVQGDHRHPRRLAPEADPSCAGRVPGQPAAAGQGQHGVGGRVRGAGARRSGRLQTARGLGIHARRGRRGPARRGGVGAAGRPALGLAQRGRVRGQHDRRHRGPQHLRVPRRGGRRWARPGHPDHRGPAQRAAGLDQPDPAAHRQHGGRAPRHADGLPSPESGGARRTWPSPSPGSAPPPSPPKITCTTWAPSPSRHPTPRRWGGSAR